jgi:hypothetical protein
MNATEIAEVLAEGFTGRPELTLFAEVEEVGETMALVKVRGSIGAFVVAVAQAESIDFDYVPTEEVES